MPVHGQGCRLVWFPAPTVEVSVPDFFQDLTGTEPDTTRKNKSPSPTNPFLSLAEGDLSGFKVSVSYQPGRMEFVVSPDPSQEYPTIPLVDLMAALQFSQTCVERAVGIPDAVRLSCLASKYVETKSQAESNEVFSTIVGFEVGIQDALDQVFQVNRRCDFSGVSGNRVTTVNVMETQSFTVRGGGMPQQRIDFGVGVNLDFNTVPDGGVLGADRQKKIFSSIIEGAMVAANCRDLSFLRG